MNCTFFVNYEMYALANLANIFLGIDETNNDFNCELLKVVSPDN